jgi:hypothetical protein
MAERADSCRRFTALICGTLLFGLTVTGGSVYAEEAGTFSTTSYLDEISAQNTETFIYNIEGLFSTAMKKNLQGKNLVMAIFMSDYSSGRLIVSDDPWLADEVEDQAKLMAREAIFEGLARTVNSVRVLRRVRDYGRSLSTAEVTVKEGKVDFNGPSLDPNGASPDPQGDTESSLHSRLKLEGGVDLGMSWRTTYGPFEYRMTYFLIGGDVFGVTLENRLNDWSRLAMNYRFAFEDQRAIASLRFALP